MRRDALQDRLPFARNGTRFPAAAFTGLRSGGRGTLRRRTSARITGRPEPRGFLVGAQLKLSFGEARPEALDLLAGRLNLCVKSVVRHNAFSRRPGAAFKRDLTAESNTRDLNGFSDTPCQLSTIRAEFSTESGAPLRRRGSW